MEMEIDEIIIVLCPLLDKFSVGSINGMALQWKTSEQLRTKPKRSWTSKDSWERFEECAAMTNKLMMILRRRELLNDFHYDSFIFY
jgi:hypothetical protein